METMLLKDKKAIVTGGNSGIGRAIAVAYAQEGAEVFILARNEEKNADTIRQIESEGGTAHAFCCDVSIPGEVGDGVGRAIEAMGQIDILANVAGISPKAQGGMKLLSTDMDVSTWDEVIRVNLNSVFYVSRLVARHMMARKYGKIVNMSSIAGLTGSEHGPASCAYYASKAGIIGLTRSMAYELAPHGITVNAAAPGRIESAMSAANNESYNRRNMNDIPMHRFGRAGEVADLFVFYASDRSSYIVGETTLIAGGWLIR